MQSMSWADFTAEVLSLYQPPVRRRATLLKMSQALREFAPHCHDVGRLSPAAISAWLGSNPNRAAATHRSLLSCLRAACSYGVFRRYLETSPFAWRRLDEWLPGDELVELEPFRRHRSAEEVKKVLLRADFEARTGDWIEHRLLALVYTWAYTGCHKTEALGLRVTDVDLGSRIISVRSHARRRLKTAARVARLPIADPLFAVLSDWVPRTGSEWLFPHQLRTGPWLHGGKGRKPLDRVRQLGERAGVPGLTVLSLQHTFGTLSEHWGIGELALQRLLRHSRPATQKHYRHEDLELMRGAIGLVRF